MFVHTATSPPAAMSLKLLAKLDAFPKQREEAADLFLRTASGGVITLLASSIMVLLFFSELSASEPLRRVAEVRPAAAGDAGDPPLRARPLAGIFLRVETTNELTVDTSRGEQMLVHVRSLLAPPPVPPRAAPRRRADPRLLSCQAHPVALPCRWMSHFLACRAAGSQ